MVYTVFIEDFEHFAEPSTSVYVLEAPNAHQAQADAVERYCAEQERHDSTTYTFTTRPKVIYCVSDAPVHDPDRDGAFYTDSRSTEGR